MYRGGLVVTALICGCFGKPGFSGVPSDAHGGGADGADDDANPDACTGAWGAPIVRHELDNMVTGEPTITADLLNVYYAKQLAGASWQIHWASRSDQMSVFVPRGQAPFDPGSMVDQDPSITSDGMDIIFRATQQGVIQEAKYEGTSWNRTAVFGLEGLAPDTLDLSGDGLTIYYNVGAALHIAHRTTRTAMFIEASGTWGSDLHWPAVTGDGKHLYYTMLPSTYGVYEATRPSAATNFTAIGMVLGTNYDDADVTDDGAVMVVGERTGTTLAMLRRTCP